MNHLFKKLAAILAFMLILQTFGFGHTVESATITSRTEFSETMRNMNLTYNMTVFPKPIYFKESGSTDWLPDWDGSKEGYPVYQASVAEGSPNSNFSDGHTLSAGIHDGLQTITMIKFGEQLPDLNGGLIYSADLNLFEVGKPVKWGYFDPLYTDHSYSVHKILNAWDGASATWEKRPEISGPYASETMKIGVDGGHFKWNISQMVAEWYKNPTADFGVAVQGNAGNPDSYRSFYASKGYANKSYDNLDKAPRLVINYAPRPFFSSSAGYGLQANSGKGYVKLKWDFQQGVKGYKLSIFNGKEYETLDLGMATEWTSQSKGLWPTAEAIEQGAYRLALDGKGSDMPDNPAVMYQNAGGTDKDPSRYYFKITAYNDFGESAASEETSVSIPDQTAPLPVSNPAIMEASPEKLEVVWDPSESAESYSVKVGTAPGVADISMENTSENRITITSNQFYPRSTIYVSVAAKDGSGNISSYTEPITATITLEKDAQAISKSIPAKITVDNEPSMFITVKNMGSQTWTAEQGYELKSVDAGSNVLAEPLLPEDIVRPGDTKTFRLKVTEKKVLGNVQLAWRMHQREGGYFGDVISESISFVDMEKPEVGITSPEANASLYKTVSIEGTVKDTMLKNYSLFYASGNSLDDWKLISAGTAAKDNETLGIWDLSGLVSGTYSLKLEAIDEAGNTNVQTMAVNVNLPVPMPAVNAVSDQSTVVAGAAFESGLTIYVQKGTQVIGQLSLKEAGNFSIPISKQSAGTTLAVYAENNSGIKSETVSLKVSDKTAPAKPTVNSVTDRSTMVSGKAEVGSTVIVKRGTTIIGSGTADAEGVFAVPIQKQKAGTAISVTAKDLSENYSSAATKTVLDKTPPPAPTVPTIADYSTSIKGNAEKGSIVTAKKGTTVIGWAKANSYGVYVISIAKQKAGTAISVAAKDAAGNTGSATAKKVIDKTAPSLPLIYQVYSSSTSVSGKAEPYATVTVKKGSTALGAVKATSKGTYTVKIKPQAKRTVLTVVAKDAAGNSSKAASLAVK